MPVSDLIQARVAHLTNQQLADLALMADWDRRMAIRRGDFNTAVAYQRERNRLLSQLTPDGRATEEN